MERMMLPRYLLSGRHVLAELAGKEPFKQQRHAIMEIWRTSFLRSSTSHLNGIHLSLINKHRSECLNWWCAAIMHHLYLRKQFPTHWWLFLLLAFSAGWFMVHLFVLSTWSGYCCSVLNARRNWRMPGWTWEDECTLENILAWCRFVPTVAVSSVFFACPWLHQFLSWGELFVQDRYWVRVP